MELITILNRCHRFRGFVYQRARFTPDHKSIEISVRPRKGSAATCSRCHQPAPGYDQLAERRFEWGDGKRTMTKAYMLFLARWARRLSWKETAQAFRTSWDKVFDAVEHVVTWGLEQRTLGRHGFRGFDSKRQQVGVHLTQVTTICCGGLS
jgi:hypothetical protein